MPANSPAITEAAGAAFDALVALPAFSTPPDEKRRHLLNALNEEHQHHWTNCDAYQRFCKRRGIDGNHRFNNVEELPFLPVHAFKDNGSLLRSVPDAQVHTRLRSSATSGVASTVLIDKITAKRQVRALASVMSSVLGAQRRPFIVVDVDPRTASLEAVGARGAAVRGFLNLAREARYVLSSKPGGQLELNEEELTASLAASAAGGESVAVFGFTYVLYSHVVAPLLKAGKQFLLPRGSKVIHIGGWKKLVDQSISRTEFEAALKAVFGIEPGDVHDFYGFTEQIGVTYPDLPPGDKCVPVFAEVVVRNPETLEPQPDGVEGLLEFITPLPHSYPGLAVLTDDVGVVTGRGPEGTRFKVLGRAKKAEARGCGDIMGEKMAHSPDRGKSAQRVIAPSRPKLLFDGAANHVGESLLAPINLSALPETGNLEALSARVLEARKRLDLYSVDELAALIGAAARKWLEPASPLAPLRHIGLQFLAGWCGSNALRQMADRSFPGGRGQLDAFKPADGFNRRLVMAQPRGLVVHWLAGNVPLLGMLGLAQSILTRNANILKAPSTFAAVLPKLLDTFRGLEVTTHGGRVLRGDDILNSIAVLYFPREDQASASTLSQLADVRLAWGGREAVEAILNLPKRYGTDDIIFGPKLSYMAIGREMLATDRLVRRLARNAATDSSVFDQYACASPHTIFVEKGAIAASPREFAAILAEEMARAAVRIPKAPTDLGTAAKVEAVRMRYEFTEELWRSKGTSWTVLYDEHAERGLAEPCYSRVITVRAVDNILDAAQYAHKGIQTIGLSMDGARKLEFARRASALGAERFPDVGRMTYFDSPWDGMYPMERLVRWISVGGPF